MCPNNVTVFSGERHFDTDVVIVQINGFNCDSCTTVRGVVVDHKFGNHRNGSNFFENVFHGQFFFLQLYSYSISIIFIVSVAMAFL